jgi:hypothetical protein
VISFDASNRARDLLLQVRATLDDVGDPDIGWIANRWGDRARRARLGEAIVQVDEAVELLGVNVPRRPAYDAAPIAHLRWAIDAIRIDERRVAKRVASSMRETWGNPFTGRARGLHDHLLRSEREALLAPLRAVAARASRGDEPSWSAYADALRATAANVLRRSDDELNLADIAALDAVGYSTLQWRGGLGYPRDRFGQMHELHRYNGDAQYNLPGIEAVRAWVGQEVDELGLVRGEIFEKRRATLVLTHAREVIDGMPADVPAPVAALRDQTSELVERNLARMEGVKRDGMSFEPEYGELGRIRSNLEVLRAATPEAPATDSYVW